MMVEKFDSHARDKPVRTLKWCDEIERITVPSIFLRLRIAYNLTVSQAYR
jgi:hypothetical protein